MQEIREVIRMNITSTTATLLRQLNPKITGWAHYYKHVVAKRTFHTVDNSIYLSLLWWMKRRHPKKNSAWRKKKYFRTEGFRNWVFTAKIRNKSKEWVNVDLFKMIYLPIVRHIKIKRDAIPYDPNYQEYFEKRKRLKRYSSSVHWVHAKTQALVGIR